MPFMKHLKSIDVVDLRLNGGWTMKEEGQIALSELLSKKTSLRRLELERTKLTVGVNVWVAFVKI